MKTEDTRPLAQRITQGPYVVTDTYQGALTEKWHGMPHRIGGLGFSICLTFGDGANNRGTEAANTELIAEAFNVTHETGLTPRELADERDKYANRCEHLLIACEVWQRQQTLLLTDMGELREVLNLAYQEMFADALKKGSGQHGTSLEKIAQILNKHETEDL